MNMNNFGGISKCTELANSG